MNAALQLLALSVTAYGLTDDAALICKKNGISTGRAVERHIVELVNGRLIRDSFLNIFDAGIACKEHCETNHPKSMFMEYMEVCLRDCLRDI